MGNTQVFSEPSQRHTMEHQKLDAVNNNVVSFVKSLQKACENFNSSNEKAFEEIADQAESLRAEASIKGGADGGVEGGYSGGSVTGGYSKLEHYAESVYSKNKEDLIRKIAEDVFKTMKLTKAHYAQTAPLADVIAHLKKVTPNVRKGNGGFNKSTATSSGKQKEILMALAESINKRYKSDMIPMDAAPGVIANRVAEVMGTLLYGMHTEFLSVAADVARIIKNIHQLKRLSRAAFEKQRELLSKSGSSYLQSQAENINDLARAIEGESDRQLALLANSISVSLGPSGESIISLLEDNPDFLGMVKQMRGSLGDAEFGTRLGHLLAGVSSVAHAAKAVDRALKVLGMSVKDYKNTKGLSDLHAKVYKTMTKKHPDTKELEKMLAAAEILYKNDLNHQDIAKHLDSKSGGYDGGVDGGYDGGVDGVNDDAHSEAGSSCSSASSQAHGGASFIPGDYTNDVDEEVGDTYQTPYWEQRDLGRKLKNKKKQRKMVLNDFKKMLVNAYRRVVHASSKIIAQMGKNIPLDSQFGDFIKAFGELPSINQENLHYQLSRMAKDINSRESRIGFMMQLHNILE